MANPALASDIKRVARSRALASSAPPRPRQAPARPRRTPQTGRPARTRPRRTNAQASRRRSPPRSRPPAKRPVSARRVVQPAFAGAAAGAAMLPGAALRSAAAVRDLSDSGLIVRLTRGRGWIGVLSVLLFGIVALNVVSLSLNAGSGRVSRAVEELERQNSSLRAQLAEQLSASRIQGAAATEGMAVPAPEDISYLSPEDGDLERLLKLLTDGTLLSGESWGPEDASETISYLPVPSSSSASAPAATTTSPASAPPAPAPAGTLPPSSGGGSTGSTGDSTGGTGGVGL
jgi:hypothetical protein